MGKIDQKTIKFDQKQSIWAKGGQKTINFDQKTINFDQNNNPGARQRPGGAAGGGAVVVLIKIDCFLIVLVLFFKLPWPKLIVFGQT